MNAELVKRQDRWDLYGEDGSKIASSAPNPIGKLSIKNCEAIENGYDLDELAEERTKKQLIRLLGGEDKEEVLDDIKKRKFYFIEGAKAILEILGDKKFSKNKLLVDFVYFLNDRHFNKYMVDTDEVDLYLESLQQTQWDVEIDMICPHPIDTYRCGLQYGCDGDGCNHPNQIPYLDKEGCLILKSK